jgi:hypothetical protein
MKAEGLIAPTGKGRGARWVSLTVNQATGATHHKTETKHNESKSPRRWK